MNADSRSGQKGSQRRTKARAPSTRPQGSSILALGERTLAIIDRAGFGPTESARARQIIEFAVWSYHTLQAGSRRPSAVRKELSAVRRQMAALIGAFDHLSPPAKRQLVASTDDPAASLQLVAALRLMLPKIEQAESSTPRGDGRIAATPLFMLLKGLSAAWHQTSRADTGIRKVAGVRGGPLSDFACSILRAEGIRFQSASSVADRLYRMRKQSADLAAEFLNRPVRAGQF